LVRENFLRHGEPTAWALYLVLVTVADAQGLSYLNDERVKSKAPMIGLNTLRIGGVEYRLTTDRTKLL
jgi:hypothetical protein